ncbi:MAG: LPXTG cell wall anchor domain-containing protein, partial [archaeon]|nr:LPXTG cell wall anchor domain-containing protein [archaeon]
VGYGDEAEWYEGSPAAVPGKGKSLQRKVNATINESASYGPAWDSNDNSADFFIQTYPNPQNSTWTGEHGPLPPVPELPSIVLLAFGLLMLAGYVLLTKRRR